MPTAAEVGQTIFADILAHPGDPLPKLAYADWLRDFCVDEECGEWEYAFRWMAMTGRHPLLTPSKGWARWEHGGGMCPPLDKELCYLLPGFLFAVLPPPERGFRRRRRHPQKGWYWNTDQAFRGLARALTRIREIIELWP